MGTRKGHNSDAVEGHPEHADGSWETFGPEVGWADRRQT